MSSAVTLTFDDGPDPQWTPRVLSELARHGLRASFFLVGERVWRYPEVARSVLLAGHDVQLHCHRHIRHRELSEGELEHDTRTALTALAALGAAPKHWRAPWGLHTAASARVAARHQLELVRWTIDTHDWRGDPAAQMLEVLSEQLGATASARSLQADAVVLMHDALGPGARRRGCANTVELIAGIASLAEQYQLRVTPLSEGPGSALSAVGSRA